jgi:putative transposase
MERLFPTTPMARRPRRNVPGQPHHIVQRGVNRSAVFARPSDRTLFLEHLAAGIERYHCCLHAYVLMTNHIHLLITPTEPAAIARVIQWVSRSYVPQFNEAAGRTGTLWDGRYRGTVIDSERYLLACYRYIELNPVRAGMVEDPADYLWSSYSANAYGRMDSLVTPHSVYEALGNDPAATRGAYRALCAEEIAEKTLRDLRAATRTGRRLSIELRRQELMALSQGRVCVAVPNNPASTAQQATS